MAASIEIPRHFNFYVTHVDGDGHFLKLSGQLDKQSSLMIETMFESAKENLEKGIGAVHPAAIHEGIICAAKYKDGTYYRAKVINIKNIANGLVGVHFIDYGNKDIISLSTIRFLDAYDPMFSELIGQASDFYLSRFLNPTARWEEPMLLKLQSLLCYSEYTGTLDVQTQSLPLISVIYKGSDLAAHLVSFRFGIAIQLQKQEVLLLQMTSDNKQQLPNWQSNYANENTSYLEHVPFSINQNFPSNPASAMRLQQNIAIPFNGNMPATPSLISQRLLVNKVSRNTVNLKAPVRQPQQATSVAHAAFHAINTQVPPPTQMSKPLSPKKSSTYKTKLLDVKSQQKVFVSFAEEGPELFAVQLAEDGNRLQEMMDDINRRPHTSLTEPPMIGTVCLGRMSGDRIICRAIVINLSGSQCKLYFVDFGDTEMVSYYDIFDIPEEFVKPNVFALRFCLSGIKKLEKGPHLNETFKQLVSDQMLVLKVVPPEGPPLIQYGELYLDNKNVLDLLMSNVKDKLQFKWLQMLPLGARQSVLVSYVDSCIKFYVQLSDNIDQLNAVMDAVKNHCENSSSPGDLPVGTACCARFPDDGNWYRALVRQGKRNKVVVSYVDYGNEQEVDVSELRTITADLIKLPAQAMKCALKGFENKPVESKTSNQLEMLALEKTLMANVIGVLSHDTMIVTLVDDTQSPPLDIARKMNQLSQPRGSHEPKVTTPVRKDAPESFSSPEGSLPDDGRRKSFRREKSFKDDRRPPREGNDELGQRGGSFRGRENRENFDRSGPGRHSEKYGGRPDRGDRNDRPERNDRRGGPKPWENNTSPPKPAEDDWEESSPPAQQPRFNRDNNFRDNRRKPRPEQDKGQSQGRPIWKKDSAPAKRLRQAAEAASADSQPHRPSVQDRLKRDNKFNQSDDREERNDDWGNRTGRDRGNRGDRRDFGEKKEWKPRDNNNRGGFDREQRDNNRFDRPKSNFTPRDRADRSDNKSERSYKSSDSRERVGRAPPHKPRGKFTQVQYRELPSPATLEETFPLPSVQANDQHEVSVTWIISPDSFYTQILSLQPKFLEMMHRIPELYKGVKPYSGPVAAGASVLARYPADGVLYRATVVSVQPFSKFIVRYIDFGNKQLVEARDIWQLDRSLLELPRMAVHCSLEGVAPRDSEWKADPEIDLCFNAPRYQCVFQDCVDDKHKVSLWLNGASVADMLVEKNLAVPSEHQSSVTLKDEPIDMTIIVGQQIICRVTHVESFEKFYVQLDVEKADLVEQTIANFDVAKLTPPSAENVADGVHCTVKHEGKIYRAILQDVSDKNNILAVLPDYGNTITTSIDKLMILPTELSVYYYQSLQCSLNNYTAESNTLISIEDLKTKLTGNKFIIYVNYVDEVILVSTLYECTSGQKVAIFEPDEGAYDEVTPLCMRAVFNYNFGMAYISHAENLNEFYLQKSTDGDKLAALLDELYKFYEEGTPEALTSFEAEELCAAKSTDGNWYRATIISEEEPQVKVQFTDYGNSETVAKDSVKKLDAKFLQPCVLALVCGLGLEPATPDALAKLTEWTSEKEVQATLSFGSDGWLASLHLDGVDLSMKLITEKLATARLPSAADPEPEPEEAPAPEPEAEPESEPAPPPGCTQVYISHIDTPGHFWLQLADKVADIDVIQAELAAAADGYPELAERDTGALCAAKYLADDQWYRAEILDADADITTVRFVDYGNTDVLDNKPGLLKTLPEHLAAAERLAVRSSVNAVAGGGEWSEAAGEAFTALVGDTAQPLHALVVLRDVTTYVELHARGRRLTDELVAAGHAARAEPGSGALPECFASHVNSPSEFWIQLEAAAGELRAMEDAMADAAAFPALGARAEGAWCAARYADDGAWYRAQLVAAGSAGTEVLFIDYGNASIAEELRALPAPLCARPPLSRKCALQKPRDVRAWSRASELRFAELAADGATVFTVQFIASGDISIVELYLDGRSVTEQLVELCDEPPAQPSDEPPAQPSDEPPAQLSDEAPARAPPEGQALHTDGKVCYVQALDEFYMHLASALPHIDRVTEALGAAADWASLDELKVGALCAALWPDDEQWYRARVLEFCERGAHVLFVDYGNKAKCEDFRALPPDLAALEPLAKCCRLANAPEDSALQEAGKNELDRLAVEDVTLRIEFLDSVKEPTLVKLVLDGKDLLSTLVAGEIETIADIGDTEVVPSIAKESPEKVGDNEAVVSVDTQTSETAEGGDVVAPLDTPTEKTEGKPETTAPAVEKINEEVKQKEKESVESEPTEQDVDEIEGDAANNEELNESFESCHTVIENTSFEAKEPDTVSEKVKILTTPEKDDSTETLESSNDTIKTPERDDSKDSINTDTGYTSSVDKSFEKDVESPKKCETPVAESPKDESVSQTESNAESAAKAESNTELSAKSETKDSDNAA